MHIRFFIKNSPLLFLFLLLLIISTTSFANPFINVGPISKHIDTISGNSLTKINKIVQGPAGFIWLATDHGLIRFDGFEGKTFVAD